MGYIDQSYNVDAEGNLIVRILDTDTSQNIFSQASFVIAGLTTVITNYTVPVGQTFFLNEVECSGENIAWYTVWINAVIQASQRTYFGDLNAKFNFRHDLKRGLSLPAGTSIQVKVLHERPQPCNFEARILGVVLTS